MSFHSNFQKKHNQSIEEVQAEMVKTTPEENQALIDAMILRLQKSGKHVLKQKEILSKEM